MVASELQEMAAQRQLQKKCRGHTLEEVQQAVGHRDKELYVIIEFQICKGKTTFPTLSKNCLPWGDTPDTFLAICHRCGFHCDTFDSLHMHYTEGNKGTKATCLCSIYIWNKQEQRYDRQDNPWKTKYQKKESENSAATDLLPHSKDLNNLESMRGKMDVEKRKRKSSSNALTKGSLIKVHKKIDGHEFGATKDTDYTSGLHTDQTVGHKCEMPTKDTDYTSGLHTDQTVGHKCEMPLEAETYRKITNIGSLVQVEVSLEYDEPLVKDEEHDINDQDDEDFAAKVAPEKPEPVYFSSQVNVSSNIVERIEEIQKREFCRDLSFYKDFDFWILTARFNMLEQQTINRVCQKEAGVLPGDWYNETASEIEKRVKKKVKKYFLGKEEQDIYQILKEKAKSCPDTLILIIADEAHWGITKETKDNKKSAHDMLVNHWNSEEYPNVVVLEVSATPYNLLTNNRRFAIHVQFARDLHTGEMIIGEKQKGRLKDQHGKDISPNIGQIRDIHHVTWAEANSAILEQGIVATIKVPLGGMNTDLQPVYLTADAEELEKEDYCLWRGLDEYEMEQNVDTSIKEFLIKGKFDVVNISTPDEKYMLGVNEENKVVFMETQKAKQELHVRFEVQQNFGDDIISLKSLKPNMKKSSLRFCSKKEKDIEQWTVTLGPYHDGDLGCGIYNRECEYTWLIDSYKMAGQTEPGPTYCSLNYIFNTMRNIERREQLLRFDSVFDRMCKEIKMCHDSILAADYSLHILMVYEFKKAHFKYSSLPDLLETEGNFVSMLGDFHKATLSKREEFTSTLPEIESQSKKNVSPISKKTFTGVAEYMANVSQKDFKDHFKRFCDSKTRNNEDLEDQACDIWNKLIRCVMFCNTETLLHLEAYVKSMKETNIEKFSTFAKMYKQIILRDEFSALHTAFHTTETGMIVHDVASGIKFEENELILNGHLKLVRANGGINGNRLYMTLVRARTVACKDLESWEKAYQFEVLRDHDKNTLGDLNSCSPDPELKDPIFRLRRKLQPRSCEYVNKKNNSQCLCQEYKPNGGLHCTNKECGHLHREIKQYSHLTDLPCILILVEKGRMGDTFPRSFNTMDLRLQHFSPEGRGTNPFMSTMEQELGRMCRYAEKKNLESLPYALIGKPLFLQLKNSLSNSASYKAGFVEAKRVDVHVIVEGDKSDEKEMSAVEFKAGKDSFDNANLNRNNQMNRFLLHASPQVGKTGAFLRVIALLRKIICGNYENEQVFFSDDENISDNDDEDQTNLSREEDKLENWQFPYWKTMENCKDFKHRIDNGKYCKFYGPYEHGKAPENQIAVKNVGKQDQAESKKILKGKPAFSLDKKFKAETYLEKSSTFPRDYSATLVESIIFNHSEDMIKMSIPNWTRYEDLFNKSPISHCKPNYLDQTMPSSQAEIHQRQAGGLDLLTYIFTPTLNRAEIANLNLESTMVDPNTGEAMSYIHILVVRKENFNAYYRCWKSTHAILELPGTMVNCETDVSSGGIGYARLFVQRFAEFLGEKRIIMMDDNIPYIYERKTQRLSDIDWLVRNNGSTELVNVPLYKVLKNMENLFDYEQIAPKEQQNYEPYPSDICMDGNALSNYTGPCQKYGVLGVFKCRSSMNKVKTPFKRTHVYSLVMCNIESLSECGVAYKPWQVFEDCNLNSDCHDSGLYVCKNNRFIIAKREMKTWMPDIYEWQESTSLERLNHTNTAEECSKIIHKWICTIAPPKRVEVFPHPHNEGKTSDNSQDIDLFDIVERLRGIRNGRYHTVAFFPGNKVQMIEDFKAMLSEYFQLTKGIGGFDKHVLLFPTNLLLKMDLKSYVDIRSSVLDQVFAKEADLLVRTSHRVEEYNVPVIMVCVDGNIEKPFDKTAVGNLKGKFDKKAKTQIRTNVVLPKNEKNGGEDSAGIEICKTDLLANIDVPLGGETTEDDTDEEEGKEGTMDVGKEGQEEINLSTNTAHGYSDAVYVGIKYIDEEQDEDITEDENEQFSPSMLTSGKDEMDDDDITEDENEYSVSQHITTDSFEQFSPSMLTSGKVEMDDDDITEDENEYSVSQHITTDSSESYTLAPPNIDPAYEPYKADADTSDSVSTTESENLLEPAPLLTSKLDNPSIDLTLAENTNLTLHSDIQRSDQHEEMLDPMDTLGLSDISKGLGSSSFSIYESVQNLVSQPQETAVTAVKNYSTVNDVTSNMASRDVQPESLSASISPVKQRFIFEKSSPALQEKPLSLDDLEVVNIRTSKKRPLKPDDTVKANEQIKRKSESDAWMSSRPRNQYALDSLLKHNNIKVKRLK